MTNAVQNVENQESTDVVSSSDAMIAMIERVATNPQADVDKMERLIKMKLDLMDRDAEQQFNIAMVAAQMEMPKVVRDKENKQTNSKYASFEAIEEYAGPTMSQHGFAPSFGTADCPKENHYRVTCDLMHNGGHRRQYHADIPADTVGIQGKVNKTATHGFGSSVSYGRRYLITLMFNITIIDEDDDGNKAGKPTITEEQEAKISSLITQARADKDKYLGYLGIDNLSDLPAANYANAIKALNAKIEANKAVDDKMGKNAE